MLIIWMAKDASKQVPIGIADGTPNFSIRVFTIQPGGYTPHHSHDSEHLNYILAGEAKRLRRSPADNIRRHILVKPQEKHQYRNTGSTC